MDERTQDALVLTERIRATRDEVFDFLVEPDKLLRWIGTDADIDPQPGGKFWLNVTGDDIAIGSYLEVDRPNRVVFTWGWDGSLEVPPGSSTVTFTLTADGDETVVELAHAGLPMGQDDEHRNGWVYFLGRLVDTVSGHELNQQR
ncbi:MAG: SRPBCC domain-containing protein [Acidobacteria bacterium]|nr:SRPBCC domain-containing protein [Acidobacteriota bacterium]